MERGCFTGVGAGTQPQPRPNSREDQPGLQLNSPCLLLPPASASWLEATGQRAWATLEVSLLQHREQGAEKASEQGRNGVSLPHSGDSAPTGKAWVEAGMVGTF